MADQILFLPMLLLPQVAQEQTENTQIPVLFLQQDHAEIALQQLNRLIKPPWSTAN